MALHDEMVSTIVVQTVELQKTVIFLLECLLGMMLLLVLNVSERFIHNGLAHGKARIACLP